MVIIRERKTCGDSTCLIKVRFEATDAKKDLKRYIKEDGFTQLTEEKIKSLYINGLLASYPRKKAVPIAEWLFKMAKSHGYVFSVPKVNEKVENRFFVNPDITRRNKRQGKEEDDE